MEETQLPFERRPEQVWVRRDAESDPQWGKNPEERSVEELIQYGIINLNKPSGPSSHQVADYVQRILAIPKAGHSGTLDPKVTGVLPVALAQATRIVQGLLKAGKEYVTWMHIHKPIPEEQIRRGIRDFLGKIQQLPPVRSAVKRQIRTREIYYLKILEIENQEVLFRAGCEAGTYIRKLVHDMGKKLGTGAHMTQLVRTKAGPFTDATWHSLQDVRDAYEFWKEGNEKEIRKVILPFEAATKHLQKVWIMDNAVSNVCHGASLGIQGITRGTMEIKKGDLIAVFTGKNELVCLGDAKMSSEEMQKAEKGFAVSPAKIFMERNIYQRTKK